MVVSIQTRPTFKAGNPRVLFEGFPPPGGRDISPDGQRFLMMKQGGPTGDSKGSQINVVLNWSEELKRRVPTGK